MVSRISFLKKKSLKVLYVIIDISFVYFPLSWGQYWTYSRKIKGLMLYLCNMQLVTQHYQLRAPCFFLGFGMINPSQTWLCKGLRISLKYYFHFILEIFLFTIWEWTRDDHTAFSTIISLKPRRKIWIHLHFLLNTYIPSLTQSFDTMQWSFLCHNLSTVTSIIISSFVILPTVEFLWVFFSHDVKSVCNGGILGEKQKRKTEQFMILLTCRNKN